MKKIILCLLSFLISLSVYSQDIEKLKRKAEAGNDKAKIDLSVYYIHEGTESDKRKVYTMLKDIYISNQVYKNKRDYCLGICYYWGWGVKKDYLRAFGIFEGLCILGFDNFFPDVEYYKGECYYNGYGTPESKGAAYIAFYHSALHGSALSRLALGRMVHDGHQNPDDLEHIFNWIREEVEDKQCTLPIAQYYLGYLYQNGLGTQKNEAKAIEWYKKSTDPLAKKQLAVLEDQMRILQEALPKPEGANMEVRLLYSFEGGSQCVLVNSSGEVMAEYNIKEEKLKSYHDKDNDAMRFACYFYKTTNKEILNSKRKAFKLFLELALNNNSQAQYMVGRMYEFGLGVQKDDVKAKDLSQALAWYNKAVENGFVIAKSNAASLMSKGIKPAKLTINNNSILLSGDNTELGSVYVKSEESKQLSHAFQKIKNPVEKPHAIDVNPSEKRVALLIGNEDYSGKKVTSLVSPKNDVVDLSAKLKNLGFANNVIRTNLSRNDMRKTIHNFCDSIKKYDVVLFYYSGHAIQHDGSTLLLTTGSNIDYESDYKENSVSLYWILDELKQTGINTKIIVMDACRNNTSGDKGIEDEDLVKQTNTGCFLAYAARAGEKAKDGVKGIQRNSAFTKVLLDYIDAPKTINDIFEDVIKVVEKETYQKQKPRYFNDLSSDYRHFSFFRP